MSKTVFLGVEGSGKTSLTVALAQAFENHKKEGWYLKPLSRDSFRFLKTLPDILDGNFPSQTADLRELRWQAEYEGNDLGEIAILDYPGEIYRLAFLDANDERDPEAFRQKVAANRPEINALLHAIKEANDVFVLFNLSDGMDLRGNPRNLDAVWVTNECLKLLKRLESKPRIRLIFTQADRYRDAGLDLATFSPKSIDLIGHDHSDVPWSLVSVIDKSESEYGIDGIVQLLITEPLQKLFASWQPADLNNIDVAKLVGHGKSDWDKVGVNQSCFDAIEATVNATNTSIANQHWMVAKIQPCFWSEQHAEDWKVLSKAISEIDGVKIRDLKCQISVDMFKTDWGKDLARRIAERVEGFKKEYEEERRTNKIGLFFAALFFALLVVVLILLRVNAGSAK